MITIDLRDITSDDMKHISSLRRMGVSDEMIQIGYENTKKNREKENEKNEQN